MTSVSTVPVSSTLKSLGLEPGDALFVDGIEGDMATVSLARRARGRATRLSAEEFLKKWTGKFPTPEAKNDERLAHILAKHVK